MSRTRSCTHHCRRCGSHFTSLAAFDAHHEGSGESLNPCAFPDEAALVEVEGGVCKIGHPSAPQVGIVLYEHRTAGELRDRLAKGDLRFRRSA